MLKKYLHAFLFILALAITSASQIPRDPGISSPQNGDLIQGKVKIIGNTSLSGFQSAEIAYAYDSQDSNTWFLLNQLSKPVNNDGTLATWDTSTITDGVFKLRLRINLKDGSTKDFLVSGLRVRNYTEIETNTPAPTSKVKQIKTNTPELSIIARQPTSRPLPPNPAQVNSGDLLFSLLAGGTFVIILFIGWGLYLFIRKTLHR